MTPPQPVKRRLGVRRWGRAMFAAGLVGGLLMSAGGPAAQAASGSTAAPVTLSGEGSWDPYREVTGWQNDLFGANGLINLNYVPSGGFQGRQDFIGRKLDYVIAGVPFTPSELAKFPSGPDSIIDAPVFVSAVAFTVVPPRVSGRGPMDTPAFNRGWVLFRQPCDDTVDPKCDVFSPFTGPVNLPAPNAIAMLLSDATNGTLSQWNDPQLLTAEGLTQGKDFAPPDLVNAVGGPFNPVAIARSDPNETNYYLQLFGRIAAPSLWAALAHLASGQGDAIEPIAERLSPALLRQAAASSRSGVDQQVLFAIEAPGANIGANIDDQGSIEAVPPSALEEFRSIQSLKPSDGGPGQRIFEVTNVVQFAKIQNGAHEYVAPTPDSIDAAVNATGDNPLAALTSSIPGAYPLVYVDHLYAPAHGLSVAKTEALATTIRYLATAGQASTMAHGDGQLSRDLVNRALAAANQLVLSNCVGSGTQLLNSSDPGPYAPSGTLVNIGAMLHCTVPPPTPTTSSTTVPASTTSTLSTSAGGQQTFGNTTIQTVASQVSGSVSTGNATSAAPPIAVSAAPVSSGATGPVNAALTVSKLPLPLPGAGSPGFDRLATMAAGAALLFLALRLLKSVARALQ